MRVAITWDRHADRVEVGKRSFDRRQGGTFVVVRMSAGTLRVTQLSEPGPYAHPITAMESIRARMKDDPLIRGTRLVKEIDRQ